MLLIDKLMDSVRMHVVHCTLKVEAQSNFDGQCLVSRLKNKATSMPLAKPMNMGPFDLNPPHCPHKPMAAPLLSFLSLVLDQVNVIIQDQLVFYRDFPTCNSIRLMS